MRRDCGEGCIDCSASCWKMQTAVILDLPSYLMKTRSDNPGGQHQASPRALVYPAGRLLWAPWQTPVGLGTLNTCSMRKLECEHQLDQFAHRRYIKNTTLPYCTARSIWRFRLVFLHDNLFTRPSGARTSSVRPGLLRGLPSLTFFVERFWGLTSYLSSSCVLSPSSQRYCR